MRTLNRSRAFLLATLLCLQSFAIAAEARIAWAQNDSEEQLWLPLSQFGYPTPLRLSGQFGERYLYLPIPGGMRADAFRFTLRFSADVQSGFLELYNRQRVLQSIVLETSPQTVEVSLDPAQVEGNYLVLRLVSRLRSQDNVCETAYVGAWLDLEAAEIRLSGTPLPPHTVSDFFPPLLSEVILEATPPLSATQAEAVLRLTATLTRKYANQPLNLWLVTEDEEIPAEILHNPLARRIVVRNHPQAEIRLLNDQSLPTLLLQGEGPALATHSEWLSSSFASLGVSQQLQVLDWNDPSAVGGNLVTLADLGYSLQQVSGVGRLEIPFAFSQADLGGDIKNLRVRLIGTNTPLEALASATLTVLFNGAQVHSRLLTTNTQFDLYLNIPNTLLRRENTLIVRFDYTPRQGECRIGVSPFSAQVWESSTLQYDQGNVLPIGFQRFPQSFLPAFEVTVTPLNAANLRRAVELVRLLQSASKQPLRLKWSEWQTASSSSHSWLIVQPNAAQVKALNPPLDLSPFRLVDVSGRELLRFEGEMPFAVLQAFEHNNRSVLLLGASGDLALMDQLLLNLKQNPNGWYDLSGDVYLLGEGMTQGVGVDVRGGAVRVVPLQPSLAVWLARLRPYLFGVAFVALLAFLIWLYPKLVRKQPTSA